VTNKNQLKQNKQRQPMKHSPHHRYSLFMRSPYYPKFHPKLRTQSNPSLTINNHRQNSLATSEHYDSWLKLTNSVIVNNSNEIKNVVCV
jgi:hypothetical protein